MGRKRQVPEARCIEHPGSHVISKGTYETLAGRRRQYQCTPAVGDRHRFSVAVDRNGAVVHGWTPLPACPHHPSGLVVRNGTYGRTTGKPRQRYRCTPADGSMPHTFTPPLPCEHAHEGREQCDVWPDAAAEVALGDWERYARGFFEMTGKEAGTGGYTTWLDRGIERRVCDAALWLCVEHWRHVEMFKRAEQVIRLDWHARSRHPDIADAYAGQLAAGGRLANLDRALEICDEMLETADGSTHPGFGRLRSRRNQLAGRRQRLLVRPSGEFDEDGNPIAARRHHPTRLRRVRPSRFLSAIERDASAGASVVTSEARMALSLRGLCASQRASGTVGYSSGSPVAAGASNR